jgi:hypothetical protein
MKLFYLLEHSCHELFESRNISEQKILSFINLPQGWHFGEGVPSSHEAAKYALSILYLAQTCSFQTDAIPGLNGEIQVICYNEDDRLEFTIEPDNTITFIHERDGQEISYYEGMNLRDTLIKLNEYRGRVCDLSESSIHPNISGTREDLAVWHSQVPPTGAAFQLFPSPV